MLFLAILGPLRYPKIYKKGPQVSRMFGPMSALKNKPLTKSLLHSFRRNGPKQPEKQ
jgi:hypothetical protein